MGGALSTTFEKEYDNINKKINNIITLTDDKKINCNEYTMVTESSLKKHLKIELEELKDSIYIVPKTEEVKNIKKVDICSLISDHYKRIVNIIEIIRTVYDVEKEGRAGIAQICFGNVEIDKKNILHVYYCDLEQMNHMDEDKQTSIDFKGLSGLDNLCTNLLSLEERKVLLSNMETIISNEELIDCDNVLFSKNDYNEIKGIKVKVRKGEKSNKKCVYKKDNYNIKVGEKNPIIDESMCLLKKSYSVNMSDKRHSKELNEIMLLKKRMESNYKKNLQESIIVIDKIITTNVDGKYLLKALTNKELDIIENSCKKTLSKLYIQSIADYKAIHNKVKHLDMKLSVT
jgi:hypothetical protein